MALYFQWDSNVTIEECETELENERLQVFASLITGIVLPIIEPAAWGSIGYASERAYNMIYCAVRNTPGRLNILYG